MTLSFLFFQNLGMIVGHVYTVSLYITSMKINSFSYWDLKYQFLRSPKSAAFVINCSYFIYGYFNFGFGSYHSHSCLALGGLFGEAKPCQVGLVLGQGTPFGMLIYFDFEFIFQKKRVLLFKHAYRVFCYIYKIQSQKKVQRTFFDHVPAFIASSQGKW